MREKDPMINTVGPLKYCLRYQLTDYQREYTTPILVRPLPISIRYTLNTIASQGYTIYKVGQLCLVYISSQFLIRLNLLPANFQFSVVSSSWKNSLYLYLEPIPIELDLLSAIFQLVMESSSHTSVVATVS